MVSGRVQESLTKDHSTTEQPTTTTLAPGPLVKLWWSFTLSNLMKGGKKGKDAQLPCLMSPNSFLELISLFIYLWGWGGAEVERISSTCVA